MEPSTSANPPKPKTAGIGIRSRVTLVCAECKRQKLKCDRREPCSTCTKRGTESKCEYSAEAADRIDNQSLANRIASLESMIQALQNNTGIARNHAPVDRTLLAVGNRGSSLIINYSDASRIWMEHLDILKDVTLHPVVPERSGSSAQLVVTKTMLGRLPCDKCNRDLLLEHLETTMSLHPCLNFPHFRSRFNAMFDDATEPPTSSFFALVSAGLALAAHSLAEANQSFDNGDKGKGRITFSPSEFWEISKETLITFEARSAPDMDSLTTMVLQVLFLLHDGESWVDHNVFPLVGKMVNTARAMGLQQDPNEYGSFTPFEGEMRRRLWWTIYLYDMFISEYMGLSPLITEDSYTCQLPKDTDEDKFTPESIDIPLARGDTIHPYTYFLQKSSMAKLVKGSHVTSIDSARELEQAIKAWLQNLPESYKLSPESKGQNIPAILMAQQCELMSTANQHIIAAYVPYLKANPRSPDLEALRTCLESALVIIRASETMFSVLKATRPTAYMFYPFGRALFHAAIIAANTIISDARSAVAQPAMQHLHMALKLLSDPALPSGRPIKYGALEGRPGEALRLIQMLVGQAETSLTMAAAESFQPGFRLPYVGSGVSTRQSSRAAKTEAASDPAANSVSPTQSQSHRSTDPIEHDAMDITSLNANLRIPGWVDTSPTQSQHDLAHHGPGKPVKMRAPPLSIRHRSSVSSKDSQGRSKGRRSNDSSATSRPGMVRAYPPEPTPTTPAAVVPPAGHSQHASPYFTGTAFPSEDSKPPPQTQPFSFPSATYDYGYRQTSGEPAAQFYNYPATQPQQGYHNGLTDSHNGSFMSGLSEVALGPSLPPPPRNGSYPMMDPPRGDFSSGRQPDIPLQARPANGWEGDGHVSGYQWNGPTSFHQGIQ